MITKAATKIKDYRQDGKELIIPLMCHGDLYIILKAFGYTPHKEYKEIEQGFLNHKGEFLNRREAWEEAYQCRQLKQIDKTNKSLFSEDIW